MKSNLLRVIVLVALGIALWLAGSCHGKQSVSGQAAVRAHEAAVRASDSVEKSYAPVIAGLRDSANRNALSADTSRSRAQRLQRAAQHLRDSLASLTAGAGEIDTTTPIAPGESPAALLGQAFDSLLASNVEWVRVDSLNQRIIQQKDSLLAADSVILASLRKVRLAGIAAVRSQRCTLVLGIGCPSRGTVALVALGVGIIAGFELGRH